LKSHWTEQIRKEQTAEIEEAAVNQIQPEKLLKINDLDECKLFIYD
jgi:hypothetical protein